MHLAHTYAAILHVWQCRLLAAHTDAPHTQHAQLAHHAPQTQHAQFAHHAPHAQHAQRVHHDLHGCSAVPALRCHAVAGAAVSAQDAAVSAAAAWL